MLMAHPQEKIRNGILISMKVMPHTSHLTPHTSHVTPHTSLYTSPMSTPLQPVVKCDWPLHWQDMPQQLYQLLSQVTPLILQPNLCFHQRLFQLHATANHGIIGPLKFLADHTESFLLHKVGVMGMHTSHITPHTSHLAFHTLHLTPHTSHLTPHTSHLTPYTSHLAPHISHLTPHTSHLTGKRECLRVRLRPPPLPARHRRQLLHAHPRRSTVSHARSSRQR
jgi:hypothetical protein